jgi:hypothetical protein
MTHTGWSPAISGFRKQVFLADVDFTAYLLPGKNRFSPVSRKKLLSRLSLLCHAQVELSSLESRRLL